MDSEQFEEVFNRYGPLVWAMIRRFGVRGPDSEDLFIETWEAVWKNLPGFAGRARLSTWIAGIARNRCVDHLRRKRIRPVEDDELEQLLQANRDSTTLPLLPPRDEAIRAELREAIGAALEGLSPVARMIVKLWMSGHRYRTIAELLRAAGFGNFDTNSVGKKLFQAKARIRAFFRETGIKPDSYILE